MQNASQPTSYVLYCSRCRDKVFGVTDIHIMRSSLKNNSAADITGFLHRENGCYIQYFEGPAQSVSGLHDLLLTDTRHFDFQLLDEGRSLNRNFSGWSMGYSNESASQIGLFEEKVEPSDISPDRLLAFLRSVSNSQAEALGDGVGVGE